MKEYLINNGTERLTNQLITNYLQSNKVREEQVYEAIRKKHAGVGNEKTTKEEWSANISKDTYAGLAMHQNMLEYVTLASNYTSKKDAQLAMLRKVANPPTRPASKRQQ